LSDTGFNKAVAFVMQACRPVPWTTLRKHRESSRHRHRL